MKTSPLFVLLAGLLPAIALAQDDQRDKQRARDRFAYVLSQSLPALREMCSGLDRRYAARFDEAVPHWREANRAAIERGRAETAGTLPRGESIEAHEAEVLPRFEAQLAALPRDRKKARCEGSLQSLLGTVPST